MKFSFISFAILSLLSSSCYGCRSASDSVVTIGTFNMEWLGDGDSDDVKPRREVDYENIAKIIKQSDADILGVEEVENSAAILRVLKYLPEYKFLVGTSGRKQNVGVIFRNTVQVSAAREYLPIATRGERNRPGFIVHCQKENFDWLMMVVHLKSTSRFDSTMELKQDSYANRREQIHVLRLWIDSLMSNAQDKDVVVVGDFNDYPLRDQNPTLSEVLSDQNFNFLTRDQHSCANQKWFAIDHIVVSQSVLKRWNPLSLHNVNIFGVLNPTEAAGVSDHCPVVGQFDCSTK